MTDKLPLTPEAIRRLTVATDPWLSCDDCFDEVDSAVEGVLTHAAPLTDPFRVHLQGCSVCYEEAHALAMLVAPDYALAPEDAAQLLESAVHGPTQSPTEGPA
jgi:hypothetical protein